MAQDLKLVIKESANPTKAQCKEILKLLEQAGVRVTPVQNIVSNS